MERVYDTVFAYFFRISAEKPSASDEESVLFLRGTDVFARVMLEKAIDLIV